MKTIIILLNEETKKKTTFLIDEHSEEGINELKDRFLLLSRKEQEHHSFKVDADGFYTGVPYFMKAVLYNNKNWDYRQSIKTNMQEYFQRSKLAIEKKKQNKQVLSSVE